MSLLSFLIAQLLLLLIISRTISAKSLESRAERIASISKAFGAAEPLSSQGSVEFRAASSEDASSKDASSMNAYVVPADGSFDPVREIFRKALAKSPGERLGRLDKQNGRLVLDRVIEKRSAYLNMSSIEELLEQELNSVDTDEPGSSGCYIEIKIIKRIPGRCSTLDGRPICKTDNYYKSSDECSHPKRV